MKAACSLLRKGLLFAFYSPTLGGLLDGRFGRMSMLTVTAENIAGVLVLRCLGRIVRSHETSILCTVVRQESRNVVLDLSKVDAIDAAGVGALIALQASGVYLRLLNPTQQVREVLRVTGLDSIFEICESRSTAATAESIEATLPGNQSERSHVPVV
jgi:anti-anti-sigma factor